MERRFPKQGLALKNILSELKTRQTDYSLKKMAVETDMNVSSIGNWLHGEYRIVPERFGQILVFLDQKQIDSEPLISAWGQDLERYGSFRKDFFTTKKDFRSIQKFPELRMAFRETIPQLNLANQEIARMLGVNKNIFSHWKSGHSRINATTLGAFIEILDKYSISNEAIISAWSRSYDKSKKPKDINTLSNNLLESNHPWCQMLGRIFYNKIGLDQAAKIYDRKPQSVQHYLYPKVLRIDRVSEILEGLAELNLNKSQQNFVANTVADLVREGQIELQYLTNSRNFYTLREVANMIGVSHEQVRQDKVRLGIRGSLSEFDLEHLRKYRADLKFKYPNIYRKSSALR